MTATESSAVAADTATAAPAPADSRSAERTVSTSVFISGVRCTLTYVIFPWVFPIIGLSDGIGPVIGLIVGTIALVSNVVSIRRMWRADHRLKWPITALNSGIIVLLLILLWADLAALAG